MGVHLSPEASAEIAAADQLLHLVADDLTEQWLQGLHPNSVSLRGEYHVGEERGAIYERIVERLLAPVRDGKRVAAAFYGHPGVYVTPSHEAIDRALAEGHDARMLPAISAEDCLFADLNVDPATTGFASYDATDFLIRPPVVDTASALVLWQISVVGVSSAAAEINRPNLAVLVERLAELYPPEHEVVVYEASPYPVAKAVVLRVALRALADAALTPLSTLYVPPARVRAFDGAMAERLGFSTS